MSTNFLKDTLLIYQDSNLVQEYILTSISRGNNIFMVGDVKQSIYKFRQARPDLFLGKYKKYKTKNHKTEQDDLKIQLFKNFRSRKEVLDFSNYLFKQIMGKPIISLGGVFMICPKCKFSNDASSAKFCPKCGKEIIEDK